MQALVWKSWRESRMRFLGSLVLLSGLVIYCILTSSDFLSGYAIQHPDEPLTYSGYIWIALFDYFFQGLWIACAFVLGLGGLRREYATGEALYSLGLPVSRDRLLFVRGAVALAESISLALGPTMLIPVLSLIVGQSYSWQQAFGFALLLGIAGTVFLAIGIFLSTLFEGEFTAPIVGLCVVLMAFFAFKAKLLSRWSIFDVMNGARHINQQTHLLNGTAPWLGIGSSVAVAIILFGTSRWLIRSKDF